MSNEQVTKESAFYRGLTLRELNKAIFDADLPESIVQELPAQSLYMLVKANGLQSSLDLLEISSTEQLRTIIDLDIWTKDQINEDAFWDWLALTDAGNDLEFLQRFLKVVDLKLVALMIARYVDVQSFDERTESPPGEGYHTPDTGFTWIGFSKIDGERHFLLARLVALIFETSRELFYQLISIPSVTTESLLEEESYGEQVKRLASEGIPEIEVAAENHAPYSLVEAKEELKLGAAQIVSRDNIVVEPLLYESRPPTLLAKFLSTVSDRELVEGELTSLINSAIVRFSIDFSDQAKIFLISAQVKGAISIGFEKLLPVTTALDEQHRVLGFQKIYRLGLAFILQLRKNAMKIPKEVLADIATSDQARFSVIAALIEPFPQMAPVVNDLGEIDIEGSGLNPVNRAIDNVKCLDGLAKIVSN